ncbi:MAG: AAA family ATPase [Nitrospirota bacterium]
MKILELKIENVRGIKNINISPNGENMVVFGPNGSGKSAIVDAIEFLLAGRISRLTGEGTDDLSLKEHGPHVDYRDKLKDVNVKAKIKINNSDQIIAIERKMSSPTKLTIIPKGAEQSLKTYLEIAEMGQHVLSRREILKYITAEAGKRAKAIQSLLNLEKIEVRRGVFVAVQNNAERELKSSESAIKTAQGNIITTLSVSSFSVQDTLDKVKTLRHLLKGAPIEKMSVHSLKKDITPPAGSDNKERLSLDQIKNCIKEVRRILKELSHKIVSKEREIKTILEEISKDKKLKKDLMHKKLLDFGISLIDDTEACPLCEKEWPVGELRRHLEKRIEAATIAQAKQKAITEISSFIKSGIDLLRNYINNLINAHEQFGIKIEPKLITSYLESVSLWSNTMLSPFEVYENAKWPTNKISELLDVSFIEEKIITQLEKAIQQDGQELSKEQNAWDTLTKMETLWGQYETALTTMTVSDMFKKRADAVLSHFESARDKTLESIYESVKDDFIRYYVGIHNEDEKDFNSSFKHQGAKLTFEVDFYNRGLFPPHALHSEGHQDSMGLCLYFALNRYLTKDLMKLTILDDVVMSIDNNHRRGICNLLKQCFSDRQFFITTHDAIWAKQLRTEGIVKKNNMIQFKGWTIDTGPIYEFDKDMWEKIDTDLSNNDASAAAHKLRRGSEYFFEEACDLLRAKIKYRGDGRYELGDYAPAAVSAYKFYLRQAKNAASKWQQEGILKQLSELEDTANEIINKSQVEQWGINENVHYNKWANFTKSDIQPLIEAFRKLFGLFLCSSCSTMIAVNFQEKIPKSVSCNCGKFNWNLCSNA